MADDMTRLAVMIEANTKQLTNQLKRVEKDFDRGLGGGASRGAKRASKELDGLAAKVKAVGAANAKEMAKTFAIGFGGGLAGGLLGGGIEGVVGALKEATAGIAEVGAEAKRAGVDVEAFQALSYVAEQNKVSVDALTDGLKEMQLRADEFIKTGAGSGAESFKRLGYSAGELSRKLKDPSALFTEIIGKLGELDTAAQIRVADEVFGGTGGEQFVRLIGLGSDGIARMSQEARDLGLVIDRELVASATELDRKFNLISQRIGTGLKTAIVEVADAMDRMLDGLREIDKQQTISLQNELADVYKRRDAIDQERKKTRANPNLMVPSLDETNLKLLDGQYEKLTEDAMRLRDELDKRQGFKEDFKYVPQGAASLNQLGNAAKSAADNYKTFAEAMRALGAEIPGVADALAQLDARMKIESAYTSALAKARSIGQALEAEKYRTQALAALSDAQQAEAARNATVPPGYLDRMIGAESGRSTTAKNPLSSAYGIGQFTKPTWLTLFKQVFPEVARGMGEAAQLALRSDPTFARPMLEELTKRNAAALQAAGNAPTDANLYLAHFLGAAGANRVLGAAPETPIGNVVDPAAIKANPAVFRNVATAGDLTAWSARKMGSQAPEVLARGDVLASGQEEIDALKAKAEALEMTREEALKAEFVQRRLTEAEQASIPVTEELRAKIDADGETYAKAAIEVDNLAQRQAALAESGAFLKEGLADAFDAILVQGRDADEVIQGLIRSLASAALKAALLGDGPLAGLFGMSGGGGLLGALGGLFGLGKAGGGKVQPGKVYPVGERGPEMFVPDTTGTIVPKYMLPRMAHLFDPATQDQLFGLSDRPPGPYKRGLGRAGGGRVQAGVAYPVGERGAEGFVPDVAARMPAVPRPKLPVPARASQPERRPDPVAVRVVPSPYFDVVVDQRASVQARGAAGRMGKVISATDPARQTYFNRYGTTR